MRVILTENQMDILVLNEQLSMLTEAISNRKRRIRTAIKYIKNLIRLGVAVAVISTIVYESKLAPDEKEIVMQELQNMTSDETANNNDNITPVDNKTEVNSNFEEKVKAVRAYMEKILGYQNKTLNDTKLRPEALVTASEKYNFSLPLLMAAAHCESQFGSTPRAKRTNSVYSVGCYDDGRNVVSYSNPNESIVGYINLLERDYLINGKTINDLLTKGGFVNKNGDRYASDLKYEEKLSSIMKKIISTYPILK